MYTSCRSKKILNGGRKMKPLRSVLRILVCVLAVVVVICAVANAASKHGNTPLTSKMTGSHKATLKNGSLPHAASLRSPSLSHETAGSSPNSIKPGSPELAAPESALDRRGMEPTHGDNNPMPQHENGYFRQKLVEARASGQSPAGGIAPVGETLGPHQVDPTLEGIKRQFDMPPEVDLTSPVNDQVDPKWLGGPDRENPDPGTDPDGYDEWWEKNGNNDLLNRANYNRGDIRSTHL
jgi:hypothetical protein